VNTSAAFQHDYISVNETVTHQHGPGGDHTHTGTAFTTWLDFNQASMQAKVILQALEKARPEHADDFRQNFASLQTELAELDEAMKNIVSDDTGKLLIASHPVYQYLARRYHIKLKSVMWEPDSVPDNNQWLALQQLLEGHDASWMIWEGEPDAQSVARLQAMGISSLVFDPVADAPQQGDFISIMKRNLSEIAKAYRLK
jgi:zinc transport system substrate-binding protein